MKEDMTVEELIVVLQNVPKDYHVVAYAEGQHVSVWTTDVKIDDKRKEFVLFDY